MQRCCCARLCEALDCQPGDLPAYDPEP
ncbi:helix-turn-helix domain-containing protein [Nonomuraea sp. NPDC005983]